MKKSEVRLALEAEGYEFGTTKYDTARRRLWAERNKERVRKRMAEYRRRPEVKARNSERKKKEYRESEEIRAYQITRRKAWATQNREKQREIFRRHYERNRDKYLARETERRKKRDPTYGLTSDFLRYKRGLISYGELLEKYGDALARLNDKHGAGERNGS